MDIRPFRGWRYAAEGGQVGSLIAPPYDVVSQADREALLGRDPRNIVAVDLPHWPPAQAGPQSCYARAAETLQRWQADGTLVREPHECLYAYEQGFAHAGKSYRRRGLIAAVRLQPLGQGIWPHEKTFPGPKADRLKLRQATAMQLSPILGFYQDAGAAEMVFDALRQAPPDAAGELNGVTERLWTVSDAELIEEVRRRLAGADLFIADGHHRYTTALTYRDALGPPEPDHPANFVMFVLAGMDDPGLIVLPTHRLIAGLKGFDLAAFVQRAGEVMEFHPVELTAQVAADTDAYLRGQGPHAMAFAAGGTAYVGRLRDPSVMEQVAPEKLPAWRELDVSILHELLLKRYLQPEGTAEPRIRYTPDGAEALAAVRAGQADLAVLLQGTPLAAVREIALAGAVMPHKSTYFYPKVATGLVLYPLER
ncbi:MAG: hypothetical protein B1H04_05985 [Planctomycetales bacterium 4484_123]|nr:MAG: hypothetical protein B1H04_05985 [Planctomycetales bacterium 4484_123]